jgi:nuclear receptor interaction protein
VCIAILHQAAIDVRFSFVINAFGETLPDLGPEVHGELPILVCIILTWKVNLPMRTSQASSDGTESGRDPLTPTGSQDLATLEAYGPSNGPEAEADDDSDEEGSTLSDSDSDDGGYNRSMSRASAGKRVPCTNHTRHYHGHCNVDTTKDVNFYGLQDEYIVSGSDCGNVFIWEKKTGRLVNILEGDREIVNVIQRKSFVFYPSFSSLTILSVPNIVTVHETHLQKRLLLYP